MSDDTEKRKAEIRSRLQQICYPRRSHAVFTDENDHNPTIQEDCVRCQGTGMVCEQSQEVAELGPCPECDGKGVSGRLALFFQNDSPAQDATVYADDWLLCPGCGKRFSLRDPAQWTGLRHITCGQKIRPLPSPQSESE